MKLDVRYIAGALIVSVLIVLAGCESDETVGRFSDEQLKEFESQGQPDVLPPMSGGLVLSVGEDTLEVETIVDSMKPKLEMQAKALGYSDFYNAAFQPMLQKVVDEATGLVLYEKAKKDAGASFDEQIEKYVETELGKFIGQYGNDYYKAEEALRQRGLVNWEEFREFKKKELLLSVYYSKQMREYKPKATPEQIRAYYDEHIEDYRSEGVMEFMLIDLIPAKLTEEQVNADAGETAEKAALRIANELVAKIRSGEDFAEIAKQYSHGNAARKGGAWSPRRPGQLAEPWAILEESMRTMRGGEVSDPIEIEGHVFIVKLIRYSMERVQPFNEVRDQIKEVIEFEDKMAYISEISTEAFNAQNMPYLKEFVDACVERAYRKYRVGN